MDTMHVERATEERKKKFSLSGLSTFVFFSFLFLLPLFFVPSVNVSFQAAKGILVVLAVVGLVALWIMERFKYGEMIVPTNYLYASMVAIPVVYFFSALFSASRWSSFIANGFSIDTFCSIAALFVLMILISVQLHSRDKVFYGYLALFGSAFLVAVYQLIRIFVDPGTLSFNAFYSSTSNLIGKWNDLGIFFGLSTILTLITLEYVATSRLVKAFLYTLLVASLFFLVISNFPLIWIVLGLFSLVFFVYILSFSLSGKKNGEGRIERRVPFTTLVVLVFSVVFFIFGGSVTQSLLGKLNLNYLEGRPSWQSTLGIAKDVLMQDPVFGVGPNRFSVQWGVSKPTVVNVSALWNVDFNYGVGMIPTFFITTGILGLLSWLVFFALYLYTGFKAIFTKTSDTFLQYLTLSSFIGSIYLWVFAAAYVPSLVVFALAFILSGIFLATANQAKLLPARSFSVFSSPKTSFVAVFVLVVVLIADVAYGFIEIKKYVAEINFQKGVLVYNTKGNAAEAENYLLKAVSLSKNDTFFRALSEINLVTLRDVVNQGNVSDDIKRNQFQNVLGAAITNAQMARDVDQTNYANWLSLGRVYEAITPLGVQGAYESAKTAYEEALKRSPTNSSIYLSLARLDVANKNLQAAREDIKNALRLKNNYTEAIFLLSQIDAADGNLKEAIASAEAAAMIAPNDSTIFFHLGLLRYNDKNYKDAASAFERAVALDPMYSNARYFLGLSYSKMGNVQEAIAQFEVIQKYNPDNKEVQTILKNLKAGKPPISTAVSTSEPEKRKNLPVKDVQ